MDRLTLQQRDVERTKYKGWNRWSPVYMLAVLAVVALVASGCALTGEAEYMTECMADKPAFEANCRQWAHERAVEDAEYKRTEWIMRVRENEALCSAHPDCMVWYTGPTSRQCDAINKWRKGRNFCIPPHAREADYKWVSRQEFKRAFEHMRGY